VALAPHNAEVHRKLAGALEELGDRERALAASLRAVELDPHHAESRSSLGVLFQRQNRHEEAVAQLRRAIELKPDFAEAYSNLGAALESQDKLDEAFAALRQGIALNPNRIEAYANLAIVLEKQGRLDEALDVLARADAINPNCAAVHVNRGLVLERQGRLVEAAASLRQALAIDPACPEAHMNHGFMLLRDGDFARGWQEFEWRFQCSAERPRLPARWKGEPIAGRTILLCEDQGFGDTLQFIRFAEALKRRGAAVVLLCRPPLARLLATCPGIDRVVSADKPLPEFDFHLPLASLPGALGVSLANIPANVPYVFPEAELVARWKADFADAGTFKVGIAWQGSPSNKADRYRSFPLERMAPLATVGGVRLFSLQMEKGREQLAPLEAPWAITDLAERIGDFQDTAAIVRNLDLVIACDSSPAHLAGALGMPVWVALAFAADWRYFHDRDDSPWYPTMRLYRQSRPGDWQGVFARMACDLAAKVNKRG
jgi:Flp pilus assembly protein TadD